MTGQIPREVFCKTIREKHAKSFTLHARIAEELQPLVLHARRVSTPVETAIDFLFLQAYKAHDGVSLLAENGLAEDAATVTRRLLELAVQAAYIGADSEPAVCEARAGRYLAFLWRATSAEAKAHLHQTAVVHWDDIAQEFGKGIKPSAKQWGPSFKDMFAYAGREDTYVEDYSLLCTIAHGSPEEFILHYSADRFRLRSTIHVPAILTFASRYYLAVADIWNRQFKLMTEDHLTELCTGLLVDEVPLPAVSQTDP